MSKQTFSLKPFVKWVGGKRQLLKYINPLLPSKNEIKNYYEPFLGGGAVFLNYLPTKAIISDINEELIITWKVVKSHPIKLIDSLTKYVTKHNLKPKDTYIQTREIDYKSLSDIEIASRFIYLNKTGYNGMYRVNKNNKFNVPFGKKEKISISNLIDEENIKEVSKFLNNNDIKIYLKNFKDVISKCEEGDFIFVDPPYDVADECFGGYTPNKFGKSGQERLAKLLKELDEKKVKWMITNHNNDLINGLYKGFHINEVPVNRFINSNSLNRKNATVETIITNYKVLEEQKIIFKKELFLNQILKSSYNLEEYVSWDKISKSIEKNH